MGRKLYVGNLPYTAGEQDVEQLFAASDSSAILLLDPRLNVVTQAGQPVVPAGP